MSATAEPRQRRVHFTPEINLGHVAQIVSFVVAVLLAYSEVKTELAVQRADIIAIQARMTVAEATLKEGRAERLAFQADVLRELRQMNADMSAVKAKLELAPKK